MQVINGFITVDTANKEGACLSTKCGELRTNKKSMSFEIYNNFNEGIFCTTIINGKMDRVKINPKEGHIVVFEAKNTEIRIYFGLPFEDSEYSYTSLWGENYGGNQHLLGLFYTVNSTFV
jgi:hypothetical protein